LQGSVAHPQPQSLSESLFEIPEAIRALCGAQSPMDLLKVKVMPDWAGNFRSVKLVDHIFHAVNCMRMQCHALVFAVNISYLFITFRQFQVDPYQQH
jgi:hypothetical protein